MNNQLQLLCSCLWATICFSQGLYAQNWQANNCTSESPSVKSILVNSCASGGQEGLNEFITIQTGSSAYDISNIHVDVDICGNDQGEITELTANATYVANLNALAGNCTTMDGSSLFIDAMAAPTNGIIPPNVIILFIVRSDGSDGGLTEDLTPFCSETDSPIYVVFGSDASLMGLFSNSCNPNSCPCDNSREIRIDFDDTTPNDCDYYVSYNPNNLSGGDGAFIFDDGGTTGYSVGGNGCIAFPTLSGEGNCPSVALNIWLEGAFDPATQLMRTNLQAANLIPPTPPFSQAPFNYTGTEMVNVFPPEVVDWVLVELRAANDFSIIVGQKAGLLLEDGRIVDVDWATDNTLTGISFCTLSTGDYYVVVRHRNHLAIISAAPVTIELTTPLYDFTSDTGQAIGSTQMTLLNNGQWALKAGDFNANGVINTADFNVFIQQLSMGNDYLSGDHNLDGEVTIDDFNTYLPNASQIGVQMIRY